MSRHPSVSVRKEVAGRLPAMAERRGARHLPRAAVHLLTHCLWPLRVAHALCRPHPGGNSQPATTRREGIPCCGPHRCLRCWRQECQRGTTLPSGPPGLSAVHASTTPTLRASHRLPLPECPSPSHLLAWLSASPLKPSLASLPTCVAAHPFILVWLSRAPSRSLRSATMTDARSVMLMARGASGASRGSHSTPPRTACPARTRSASGVAPQTNAGSATSSTCGSIAPTASPRIPCTSMQLVPATE